MIETYDLRVRGNNANGHRRALVDWYRRNRARSQAIFDLIAEEAYYSRPIDLRNPFV